MTKITPEIQAQAQRVGMCTTCQFHAETGCCITDTAVADWLVPSLSAGVAAGNC